MGHYVYKYVYNGDIVYIGKNDTKIENRIKQHKREKKFKPYLNSDIYYCVLPNRIMSDVVESELIRRYQPILNVAKKSEWCGIDFSEPKWELFSPNKKTKTEKLSKTTIRKTKSTIKVRMAIKGMRKEALSKLKNNYEMAVYLRSIAAQIITNDNIAPTKENKTYAYYTVPVDVPYMPNLCIGELFRLFYYGKGILSYSLESKPMMSYSYTINDSGQVLLDLSYRKENPLYYYDRCVYVCKKQLDDFNLNRLSSIDSYLRLW